MKIRSKVGNNILLLLFTVVIVVVSAAAVFLFSSFLCLRCFSNKTTRNNSNVSGTWEIIWMNCIASNTNISQLKAISHCELGHSQWIRLFRLGVYIRFWLAKGLCIWFFFLRRGFYLLLFLHVVLFFFFCISPAVRLHLINLKLLNKMPLPDVNEFKITHESQWHALRLTNFDHIMKSVLWIE